MGTRDVHLGAQSMCATTLAVLSDVATLLYAAYKASK